ncbi:MULTISPECIES: HdeD family acid-resistance protein [unclassified Algibacter]|uniref:HdeD family acid-resistance protein n=1 Tax=unclassified Algibacter TaxID=2615009 RepID=UPI00131D25A5|nr:MULTISPECIES: DUF308 domain-containing protein [unclassified Algibacter]MCL5130303.1 DUF308 domain-containing protein [Algibacter sp. L4_22]
MKNTLTMPMNHKYWWIQILLGIALIGFGLWFWFTPVETFITLAIFFSAWMFVTGIFEIINAIGVSKNSEQWGLYLIGGIVDLAIGAILMANENITIKILPLFLGFWLLFRAIMFIVMYYELKSKSKEASSMLLISAVLFGVFALIILAKPLVGDLVIVYSTGFAFFFFGVYRIILGLNLRKMQ